MLYWLNGKGNEGDPVAAGFWVISRRKIYGPGTHYGVLATGMGLWSRDEVLHHTGTQYEVTTFEAFARDRSVTLHEGQPPEAAGEVLRRTAEIRRWRPAFDILSNNCEHIARFVVLGRQESSQITGLVVLSVLVLVLAAASGGK